MSTPDRYVGDFGGFTVGVTVTGLDLAPWDVVFRVRKPVSGNVVVWPATKISSAVATYIYLQGDLDEAGFYETDVLLTKAGPDGHITVGKFLLNVAAVI